MRKKGLTKLFLVSLPFLIYPYSVNIMDDSVEVVYLCPGKEKRKAYTYEIIDEFQQGKGKRDRIAFARKGASCLAVLA